MRLRKDRSARYLSRDFPGQRIEITQRLDFLVEQLDAHGFTLGFRRKNVDDVAAHAVGALAQVHGIACVLQLGQTP